MRLQEMQQGHHMLLVASDALSLPNIVDNHFQNFFTAVFLGQEVRKRVLLLRFREDVRALRLAITSSSVQAA
jgi:hypothetical protein